MAETQSVSAQQAQTAPTQTSQPAQTPQPAQSAKTAPPPGKGKKVFWGCFGGLVFFGVLILGGALAMLGKSSERATPIADIFNLDPAVVIKGLSAFATIFFILLAFMSFAMAMVAIFKFVTAKKDDPDKKKHLWKVILWGILLVVFLGAWLFSYLTLEAKKQAIDKPIPPPPIVTQPAETVNLTAPIQITFNATGMENVIDLEKFRIISYVWNFGDGETGTGVKVSHAYKNKGKENGQFIAALALHLLEKDTGKTFKNEDYKVIISIANVKTSAIFSATPEKGSAPLEVKFDASESSDPDGEIVAYEWDFDEDGQFDDGAGKEASYTFEKSGTFKVSLRIVDNSGDSATAEKNIEISDAFSLQARISVQAESNGKLLVNKSYLFDAGKSSSPDSTITKYEWNFGDGTSPKKSKTVSYAYKTEGVYEITLKVTDDKNTTATKMQKITVGNPSQIPRASIETTPKKDKKGVSGPAPFTVAFDASSSTDADDNIVEYRWDFESDGTDDKFGAVTENTFEKEGTYETTLVVEDADGNTSQQKITITVTPPGIQAKIQASPLTGTVPLLVSFDASGSLYPGGQILSYEWDFGDKTPKRRDAAKISYKYNQVGTYTAAVTAIGADGKRSTATALITVQVVPVKACYEVNKHEGIAPFEVIFNSSCSTGTISKYRWDMNGDKVFGDKTGPAITYKFETPGSYEVSLEVTDQQGVVDIFSDTLTVTPATEETEKEETE